MSIHRSLRQAGGKMGALRNVLKRHERLRALFRDGRWTEGQSVLGLPKTKIERMKVRKAAPKEAAAPEATAAAPDAGATVAAKPAAKPQTKSSA